MNYIVFWQLLFKIYCLFFKNWFSGLFSVMHSDIIITLKSGTKLFYEELQIKFNQSN